MIGTEVPIALEPYASTFVVFRAQSAPLPAAESELVEEMPSAVGSDGLLERSIYARVGSTRPSHFSQITIVDWRKMILGFATIQGLPPIPRALTSPPSASGERIVLDLGQVDVIASVRLNNKDLGIVWKAPYALDITSALVPGTNTLQIRVANLWANRLIADAGLPEAERKTWMTGTPYHPTDPLLPSGLLGPVRLLRAQ